MTAPAFDASALTRRRVLTASAGAFLLSALAACGRGSERNDPQSAGSAPELVIGASLELTGRGAALGVLQHRALQLALESVDINGVPVGNLRRTIRLEVRDNASDPGIAAQHASEMAEHDNVHALIGGCLAETSMTIIRVAQEQQVPFISLAAGDGIVLPLAQRTYIYKLTPDAADVARRLARLVRSLKLQRVVLLAANGLHGDSGVRNVTSALRTVEVNLADTVRLPETGADFEPAARQVTALRPDGVVVWGTAPDSGSAARALRLAGYDGPLFFDAGAVAEETLSPENMAAVEGAYAVHPMSLASSTLTNTTITALERRDFVFRYIQRHGGFSGFAPYAADALRLLVTAARLADSVDRGRLRAYLQTQSVEGIAGGYSFAPIRHGGMDASSLGVFTVSHGAWARVS